MEATKTVLNISVRIDSINPVHMCMSLFQSMAYTDHAPGRLHKLTRGLAGELTMDPVGAVIFIARLRPVQVSVVTRLQDISFVTEGLEEDELRQLIMDLWSGYPPDVEEEQ